MTIAIKPQEFIKLKSRSGQHSLFISFSDHATSRIKERGVQSIEVIASLCVHSDKLIASELEEEMVFLDTDRNLSIVLSVSKTDKAVYYLNIITVLDFIPVDEKGSPKFSVNQVVYS